MNTPKVTLLLLAVLLAAGSVRAERVYVVAMNSKKRLYAADGKLTRKKADFEKQFHVGLTAKKGPSRVKFRNNAKYKVVVLYYNASDKVMAIAAGKKKVKPGKSATLPKTAHRVRVYRDRKVVDKLIDTGGPYGGTIRFNGKKVSGGKVPKGPSITFENDSGEDLQVRVYNGNDEVLAIPKWSKEIKDGKSAKFSNRGGKHIVKVSRTGLLDSPLTTLSMDGNTTARIYHSYYNPVAATKAAHFDVAVGALTDNSDTDGAPTKAWVSLYYVQKGVLHQVTNHAQSYPPLRFAAGPVKYTWRKPTSTGIPFRNVGAPALAQLEFPRSSTSDLYRTQIYAFCRSNSGQLVMKGLLKDEGALKTETWDTSAAWTVVREDIASRPDAAACANPVLEKIFVVYRDTAGRVRGGTYDAEKDEWSSFPRIGKLETPYAPAVVWTDAKQKRSGGEKSRELTVFAVGANKALYENTYTTDKGWDGWDKVGGECSGGPRAMTYRGRVHVAVRWADRSVRVIRKSGGDWSKWTNLKGNVAGDPVILYNY